MFNSIDWSKFRDPLYWFEGVITQPGSILVTPALSQNSDFFWFFLYVFSGFIIAAVLLKTASVFLVKEHPLIDRIPFYSDNYLWMGILGLIWFISRQLSVAFLGARFWLLIGLVWFLVITARVVIYFIKFYPLEYRYFKHSKQSVSQ